MLITVVICTWNRARLLDETLSKLRDVRVPSDARWELLVVNNNCTDDTDAVIERHRSHLPLTRLHEPKPGLSNARNCALEHARGDLVLWTDDDVLVDAGWLESAAEGARAFPDAGGFAGLILPWFPVEPDPALMDAFPALANGFCGVNYGSVAREMTPDEHAFGACMMFRSSAVAGMRFNPELGHQANKQRMGEDVEYQYRLRAAGGTMAWLPGMKVEHYVDPARMTLRYLRRYYYGIGQFQAQREGMPGGPKLFGAPRYLFRMAAERYMRFVLDRIRGRRGTALTHLQKYCYLRGMIGGCRDLSRTNGSN